MRWIFEPRRSEEIYEVEAFMKTIIADYGGELSDAYDEIPCTACGTMTPFKFPIGDPFEPIFLCPTQSHTV